MRRSSRVQDAPVAASEFRRVFFKHFLDREYRTSVRWKYLLLSGVPGFLFGLVLGLATYHAPDGGVGLIILPTVGVLLLIVPVSALWGLVDKLTLPRAVEKALLGRFGHLPAACIRMIQNDEYYQAWEAYCDPQLKEMWNDLLADEPDLTINETLSAARALAT